MIKKVTDERLVVQNLKNIRIAYIIQTVGILGILGYDYATKGIDGMRENPLWLVFIITTVVSAYLSMNSSVDYEKTVHPQKRLTASLIGLLLVSAVIGYFVSRTGGFTVMNGVITGGIVLICGLVPILYIYKLRTDRQDENTEE
ncbi:hypothetical protein [Bacillus massiliglaciei]|uniref:hypothetical protein n=1 Tax=Bacillus massiliglaciei TaxID=1816693 RepID=UPI000A73F882|nr:hypothetical protein [Bacillus massiliglaciei]